MYDPRLTINRRSGEPLGQHTSAQEAQDELMNLMTIMYIAIQETLNDPEDMASTYGKLCEFVLGFVFDRC
jgi:hypothetical protein